MIFSFYPIMFGIGVLSLDFSLLLFMKLGLLSSVLVSLFYLFFVSFLWLKDVFLEGIGGQYSFQDSRMFRQGFRLFLFSELMLFFTVFWTILDASVYSVIWVGGIWSPVGVLSPEYIGLNAVASTFLMTNSHIIKYARRYLFLNKACDMLVMLCIFIGAGFVCFQFFEYSNNPFSFSDGIYGSVFYLGTGLHGSHVLVGVCFLVVNFLRVKMGHFNWFESQSMDLCIDYWRFLEWMWGVMFCLLYVWGS